MTTTILQIMAAFFAALGGLLISSDFIGTDKLTAFDSKLKSNLDNFEFNRWDSLTSCAGYGMYLWSKIGFAITVVIISILILIHNLFTPIPFLHIFGAYLLLVILNITIGNKAPDWTNGIVFFLMLPVLSIPFLIEWLFVVPVLIIKRYACVYEIPSLTKLAGALLVILSFIVYLLSCF